MEDFSSSSSQTPAKCVSLTFSQWLLSSYPPLHPECLYWLVSYCWEVILKWLLIQPLASNLCTRHPSSRIHIPKCDPDPTEEVIEYSGPRVRLSCAQVCHPPTVTLSKLLTLSMPQCPHPQNGNIKSIFEVFVRIQRTNAYHVYICLQHGKRFINVSLVIISSFPATISTREVLNKYIYWIIYNLSLDPPCSLTMFEEWLAKIWVSLVSVDESFSLLWS